MRRSFTVESSFGKIHREATEITIGATYQVEPLNARKKKHRNRVCTILGFDDGFFGGQALVRFHDNNRKGKVDMTDLTPVAKT